MTPRTTPAAAPLCCAAPVTSTRSRHNIRDVRARARAKVDLDRAYIETVQLVIEVREAVEWRGDCSTTLLNIARDGKRWVVAIVGSNGWWRLAPGLVLMAGEHPCRRPVQRGKVLKGHTSTLRTTHISDEIGDPPGIQGAFFPRHTLDRGRGDDALFRPIPQRAIRYVLNAPALNKREQLSTGEQFRIRTTGRTKAIGRTPIPPGFALRRFAHAASRR